MPFQPAQMVKLPAFVICSQTIERFFSKLKHFRRVATRYDKLAANFLAMVQLASLQLWLRAHESKA
jgi:uncharacterized protein (UPF0548 family)